MSTKAAPTDIPEAMLSTTAYWLSRFTADFRGEIPSKIHNAEIAGDGSPQWHPDFARWIDSRVPIDTPRPDTKTPEDRLRTTRAMRRLRRESIREFEVLYRVMTMGESLECTTRWLNERAARNNIPLPAGQTVHYRLKDTVVLIVVAVEKLMLFW